MGYLHPFMGVAERYFSLLNPFLVTYSSEALYGSLKVTSIRASKRTG